MKRPSLNPVALPLAVAGLLTLSALSAPVLANTRPTNTTSTLRQGLPGRRISGGSRSPSTTCLLIPNQPVIALMPATSLGLTLAEHPTLWFLLPAVSRDRNLEFGLIDPSGETVYQRLFEASGEAGITSFTLPKSLSPLTVDQNYKWYLSVICNPSSRSEDLYVNGWIRRVQPTAAITQQLTTATLQERFTLYQASDFWYDALTALATLQRSDPALITPQWASLLESVGLSQVATAAFSRHPDLSSAIQHSRNPPSPFN